MTLTELRNAIGFLVDEMPSLFDATKEESKVIHEWEIEHLIWLRDEIQGYTHAIVGYASLIRRKGYVGDGKMEATMTALADLPRYSLVNNANLRNWLAEQSRDFPHTQRYMITADYLRLLVIDYVLLWRQTIS